LRTRINGREENRVQVIAISKWSLAVIDSQPLFETEREDESPAGGVLGGSDKPFDCAQGPLFRTA